MDVGPQSVLSNHWLHGPTSEEIPPKSAELEDYPFSMTFKEHKVILGHWNALLHLIA